MSPIELPEPLAKASHNTYRRRMRGISIRAVVLATLAVFGVDIVSGVVLIAVFGGPVLEPGLSDEQLRHAVAAMNENKSYLTAALVLGTASTVLGGYIAARIARSVPYFNALAFGLLATFLSALTSGGLPAWFRAVGLALTVPAALLGGHLLRRYRI